MPLQKDYVTPSTGAVASYHVVKQVSLDRDANITNATVSSYLSKDAVDGGKFAMYTQQIQLAGLPPAGLDAFLYADQQLIVEAPEGVPASAGRYVFAGATVVDDA